MSAFLQVAVAQVAIAISVFNLMIYLWLGLTVLLNGNRQSRVTWIGGIGLLAAALFFLCHADAPSSGFIGSKQQVNSRRKSEIRIIDLTGPFSRRRPYGPRRPRSPLRMGLRAAFIF
jgi:hypothetical protein